MSRRAALRVLASQALLVAGVALVGAGAETGVIGWSIAGFLLLTFVPPLIFDAATDVNSTGGGDAPTSGPPSVGPGARRPS